MEREYFPIVLRFQLDALRKVTMVGLADRVGNLRSIGFSLCSPKDGFNKSTGRNIATERAVHAELVGHAIKPTKKQKYVGSIVHERLNMTVPTTDHAGIVVAFRLNDPLLPTEIRTNIEMAMKHGTRVIVNDETNTWRWFEPAKEKKSESNTKK